MVGMVLGCWGGADDGGALCEPALPEAGRGAAVEGAAEVSIDAAEGLEGDDADSGAEAAAEPDRLRDRQGGGVDPRGDLPGGSPGRGGVCAERRAEPDGNRGRPSPVEGEFLD